jgi:dihydroflavonol-4-reductase
MLNLRGLKIEVAWGDIKDIKSIKAAAKGCEALFHLAASYTLWSPDPKEIYRTNVEGTRNVLEVAFNEGLKVIYTSTVSTIGSPKGGIADENTPFPFDFAGHYKRSKYLAEQIALEFHKKGLPIVITNPTAPIGKGDIKPTPTGRMVLDFLKRKMFAYIDTGLNIIDVEDVAKGHLLAFLKGKSGERYILGNKNMRLCEIFNVLSQITGQPPPRIRLPYITVLGAAYVDEFFCKILRRHPKVPLEAIRIAKRPMFVSSKKAVCELGLPQTPVEVAFEKAICWFKDHGYA